MADAGTPWHTDAWLIILLGMQDIGGNDIQKQEIREAVELPLTQHELYKQVAAGACVTAPHARCMHTSHVTLPQRQPHLAGCMLLVSDPASSAAGQPQGTGCLCSEGDSGCAQLAHTAVARKRGAHALSPC